MADGGRSTPRRSGTRAVTVTARDDAGNETVVTHTAQVVDATRARRSRSARRSTAPSTSSAQARDGRLRVRRRARAAPGLAVLHRATCPTGPPWTPRIGRGRTTLRRGAADVAGRTASVDAATTAWSTTSASAWPARAPPAVTRGARRPRRARALLAATASTAATCVAPGYPQVAEVECGAGAQPAAGRARPAGRHRRRCAGSRRAPLVPSRSGRPSAPGRAAAASSCSGSPTAPCTAPSSASRR